MSDVDPLQIGTLVAGKYRLEQPLGQGAYGMVWRARQEKLRRSVAVKFLHATLDETAKRRFEREAKALARLDHPNCVVLIDYGHHGEQAFLVTEFLDGTTLHKWMQDDHTLFEIMDVTYQLLDALVHAHREDVIHRDLKPGNIVLVPNVDGGNRVVVLDFGIASMSGEKRGDITKTGELFGTPGFMSPEQLGGDERIGPGADLYAVGVILFTMIEKRAPFVAKTHIEAVLKHLTDEAPPVESDVPEALKSLVAQLLEKDPDDRPPTARAVQNALPRLERPPSSISHPIQEPQPPIDTPLGPPPQTPRHIPAPAPPASAGLSTDTAVPVLQTDRPLRAWTGWAVVAVTVVVALAVLTGRALSEAPAPMPAPRHVSNALVGGAPKPLKSKTMPELPAPDAGTTPQAPLGSGGCGANDRVGTGLQTISALDENLQRVSVRVFIPSGYDPATPHPVALMFHDTLQAPDQLLAQLDIADVADRDGVVIVLPEHSAMLNAWQSSDTHERARRELDVVASELCLDLGHVLLYGHGGGGLAAEELSCVIDGVHAVAVSAHRLGEGQSPCKHAEAPYLLLTPLEDERDPVEGGVGCLGGAKISLAAHEKAYRRIHGCEGERQTVSKDEHGDCFTWPCATPFVSCHVEGGRPLPGGAPNVECEGNAVDFPYGERLWEFFGAQR